MNVVIAYTLRTVCVTQHGWIAHTATTMEDDSIESVAVARAENLLDLQQILRQEPPQIGSLVISSWREPYDDMEITVQDTLIRQDLMSGEGIEERTLEKYVIPFKYMGA